VKTVKSLLKESIATKMLLIVLGCYLAIAFLVSAGNLWMNYNYQKANIFDELQDIEKIYTNVIAMALWDLNEKALHASVDGMLLTPTLVGVKISAEGGKTIAIAGIVNKNGQTGNVGIHVDLTGLNASEIKIRDNETYRHEMFSRQFQIYHEVKGERISLGLATIYSNSSVVYKRMKLQGLMLAFDAVITILTFTIALLWAFNRYLRKPLASLSSATKEVTMENLNSFKVKSGASGHNELTALADSFNDMITSLSRSKAEREQAEIKLNQSEEKFRTLFDQAADTIFLLKPSPDGPPIIADVNPSGAELHGYTPSELIGQPVTIIDPFISSEEIGSRIERLESGEVIHFQAQHVHKNGEYLWLEVSCKLIETGGEHFYLSAERDITERKKDEQARILLQSAITQAAEAIVITDPKGAIQYVNPAFEKITGYPQKEVIGNNPRVLKSDEHDNAFYHELWAVITAGRTWSGRFVNKRKDDTVYTEEATISPVHNAAGEITNFVAVKRDISEEIALEKQLRLAQKLEVIGTLANGIAHDFNNILAPIIGYSYLMQEQKGRDKNDTERLAIIMSSAQRAKELVEQILNFSRQAEGDLRPLQLKTQIEETAALLRASIPTSIDICLNLQEQLVLASPSYIHQIVLNLCTNAAHAMQNTGGKLTISLTQIELEAANLKLLPPGYYAQLTIADTGSGIAPDVLPHIFDPFFTTKNVGEGSGIGLATVQRIASSLGGHLSVESQIGHGSIFYLLLPILQMKKPEQKQITPLNLPTGNKHLLLVDDEELLVQIGTEFLQGLGYQVTALTSSTEALKTIEHQPEEFDLLITDLIMPDLTGIDLAQKVHQIRPDLPIILCTGHKESVPEQSLGEVNLLNVIQKPDIFTELAFSIHHHFNS
jgi:PAS domain S-box-containing protein